MATIPTTKAPKRKKVYNSGNFFSAPATVEGNFVTIKLPAKVAQYLDLQAGKKVYWSPVNGVVQISANVPNVVIPMINVANSGFIPKE
jgi:hypothetical protein